MRTAAYYLMCAAMMATTLVLAPAIVGAAHGDDTPTAELPANVVAVVDLTGAEWDGVQAAVTSWDNTTDVVDLRLTDGCLPGRYCITITPPADYGATNWLALHEQASARESTIRLNTWKGYRRHHDSAVDQQRRVCHELGHALGLSHPPKGQVPGAGCIAGTWSRNLRTAAVTAADRAMLSAVEHGEGDGFGAIPFVLR